MPFLLVHSERGEARRTDFQGAALLGRDKKCDVPLQDKQASRKHARVFWDGKRYYVEDLSSRNGTFVNGSRVERQVPLKDGDQIRIGNQQITFREASAPERKTRPSRAALALAQAQDEVSRLFQNAGMFMLLLVIFGVTMALSKFFFAMILSG